MPYGGAAVEIGFTVLKVSWFHRFHGVIRFVVSCFMISWLCRFPDFIGFMVSHSGFMVSQVS